MKFSLKTLVFLSLFFVAAEASANTLELGAFFGPQFLQDARYEAFSDGDLSALAVGADLRTEVADFGGFKLVPVLGYRVFRDQGSPYSLNTTFWGHDFAAGLRIRKGLLSWLRVFVEGRGGLFWGRTLVDSNVYGPVVREDYRDDVMTWTAGGVGGVEFRISPSFLRSRGIDKFNFGGELSAGYLRRGDLKIEPKLESGGDNALDAVDSGSWGLVNPSAAVVQMAFVLHFF